MGLLLVCFNKEMRSNILINNPKYRPYYTEEQCELVSGEPNKVGDQDTYEQLMTMEDKEIKFWTTYNLVPPFFEECEMGSWEDVVADYKERMRKEEEEGIAAVKDEYEKVLNSLSREEIDNFLDTGELPPKVLALVELDPNSSDLISVKNGAVIGNLDDFFDLREYFETNGDDGAE